MRACGRTACAATAWVILLACRSAPSAEAPPKPETQVSSPSSPDQEQKPGAPPEAALAPKTLFATVPERTRATYDATGDKFIVASQGEATSLAAKRMFELGGNVVDAAAAASFTIAVERPQSTGIAGGGFMLVYLADKHETLAVDFRERAPARAAETMYLDKQGEVIPDRSTLGPLAVGVPGMVAGVLDVHTKYGKLTRAQILAPAIELAEQGFAVYPHLAFAITRMQPMLSKSEAARVFFDEKNQPLGVGAVLKQPELAKVLHTIADKGAPGFYSGWVAKALIAEQKQQGGLITQADLTGYQVKYRPVVTDDYGPFKIVSMPPPSSGGIHVVEILNILEQAPIAQAGPYSATALSWTTAAMQLAYRDRAKYLGDSDFVKVPVKALTSDPYADSLRASIDPTKAHKATDIPGFDPFKYESKETTHFTLGDREGNVVASTQTINGWFGSGIVVKGTGMVLNNEMDDFSAKPGVPNKFGLVGGAENAIKPGKRPLSSMSPTIVFKGDKPVLALGSPSGSQIISCVALTALNYLTYKLPLYDAVSALRYHHQYLPDELVVEAPGLPKELAQDLETRGYHVRTGDIGCKIQAVAYEDGKLHGVSDPRGEGLVANESTHAPVAAKPAQNGHISAD
ncbi:MAG TPA: gamma-glutamyltransferase [Polyangiales bacterium]|nr:gamma-glutamyltransferase [Polyangiales bacterium]